MNKQAKDSGRSKFTLDQFIPYQIRIAGQPDENWSNWIEPTDIHIEADTSGLVTTILTVTFDQAALLGLLRRLYHLGYPLISVNYIQSRREDHD